MKNKKKTLKEPISKYPKLKYIDHEYVIESFKKLREFDEKDIDNLYITCVNMNKALLYSDLLNPPSDKIKPYVESIVTFNHHELINVKIAAYYDRDNEEVEIYFYPTVKLGE